MKKLAKIVAGFILLLFIAALVIPIFFKDRIKELIIREFENSTEATVYFDIDQFGLSLIKNFPDFTLTLGDFGVVGRGIFAGDTLMQVEDLEARVNLSEVLFRESISIRGVDLESPEFLIMVLPDGTANYDIAKASDSPAEVNPDEEAGSVNFGIQRFSISNGDFIYLDMASGVIMELDGINLKGRGDFEEEVFDLISAGSVEAVSFSYDGTEYLTQKTLDLDLVLSMDLPNSTYTFKENEFKINDFPLAIDGSFGMLENAYDLDLKFSSPSSEFKKILSLVPGIYTASFDDLETSGAMAFSGIVKGQYSDDQMPAFQLNMSVTDGYFHYPDLPESVSDVNMDLAVNNTDGVVENTRINLKKMHVSLGENPFDARLAIENLRDFPIDANLKGKLNLADLSDMLPVNGMVLRGLLDLNASAKGTYDSVNSILPTLDMQIDLKDGFIQYPDLPAPIEALNIHASIVNRTGLMADTKINTDQLRFMLDGQPFESTLAIENPENPIWDVTAKGAIDLEKIMAFYPMEGVDVKGALTMDISSSGNMKDLEAKRYRKLPASGSVELSGFEYIDESMPQRYSISEAKTTFSTRSIEIENLEGKAGQTSYSLNGSLSNHLGFFLNDEKLTGNLAAKADVLNINEWMTASDEEEVDDSEETAYEVVRIPQNVEFIFDAQIDEMVYNRMSMNNLEGKVVVKDGVIDMNRLKMDALNGSVVVNGSYDSRPEKPAYAMRLDVNQVSIPASFQSVDMVSRMAPVTEKMTGLFSTDFSISGLLNDDMMPDYTSLTGKGIIQVLEASLGQSDILTSLGSVSKLTSIASATLDKVKMSAEIRDGRLFVKPFDVKLGEYTTTVSGSTGIDGSLDYVLGMDVPSGQVGTQLNGLLSSFTGGTDLIGSDVRLNLSLKGLFNDPQVGIASVTNSRGQTVTESATASVQAQVEAKKEEVRAEVEDKVEEVKDSANTIIEAKKEEVTAKADSLLKQKTDSLTNTITEKLGVKGDTTLTKEMQETKKKAEDLLKGLFKKKKKKKKSGN